MRAVIWHTPLCRSLVAVSIHSDANRAPMADGRVTVWQSGTPRMFRRSQCRCSFNDPPCATSPRTTHPTPLSAARSGIASHTRVRSDARITRTVATIFAITAWHTHGAISCDCDGPSNANHANHGAAVRGAHSGKTALPLARSTLESIATVLPAATRAAAMRHPDAAAAPLSRAALARAGELLLVFDRPGVRFGGHQRQRR